MKSRYTIPISLTPAHGERARTLVSGTGIATLCTISRHPDGFPYGSFVTFALDEGAPVLFLSALAEHTKNLDRDTRSSLLVAENHRNDPLENGRVTLVGHCRSLDDIGTCEKASRVFLERHPGASYYLNFEDFGFWKLEVESIRYIGGYGRMSWISSDEWFRSSADPLAAHAEAIIDHMNNDHAATMLQYCQAFTRATDASHVKMTAVDQYGFEMSAMTTSGPRPIRLSYNPLCEPSQYGEFPVRLHWHSATRFFSSSLNSMGENSVPAWEPSQYG